VAVETNRSTWIFVLILAGGALIHAAVLFFQAPVFQSLPYWFWSLHSTPTQSGWLWLAGLSLSLGVWVVYGGLPICWKLILLVAIGVTVQFSLAYSKGEGLDGIRDRMVHTGHAEFADVAARTTSSLEVLRHYEQLAGSGQIGAYAPSKPPGTLLTYIAFERLTQVFSDTTGTPVERANRLRDFASYAWPILSYLAIPLIYLLGQRAFGEREALMAGLLYATVPAVNLITLHTDQAVYPLAALLFAWLYVASLSGSGLRYAIWSGVALYAAIFLSFGMLGMVVWALALTWFANMFMADRFRTLAWAGMGFAVTALLVWLAFDYEPVQRYLNATAYHQNWKGWDGRLTTTAKAALTNVVEYATWLGLPLTTVFLYSVAWAISQGRGEKPAWTRALTLALILTIVILAVFGKTKAETARLWLFLTPFIALSVAHGLGQLAQYSKRLSALLLTFLVATQFLTNVAILRYQDFF
jgi:hypothetical protein